MAMGNANAGSARFPYLPAIANLRVEGLTIENADGSIRDPGEKPGAGEQGILDSQRAAANRHALTLLASGAPRA